MKWFKNLNTTKKIAALIVVAAVFLGVVGFVGYHYSVKISTDMDNMYKTYLLSVKWLNGARATARATEADMLQILNPVTTKQQEAQLRKNMSEYAAQTAKLLGDYEKTNMDDFEKAKLAVVKESLAKAIEARGKALEIAAGGNKPEAYLYYVQNAGGYIDTMNTNLNELADHNAQNAEKANKEAVREAEYATTVIIIYSIIAVILAMALGIWIAKIIANPLKNMLDEVKAIAAGDLTGKQITVNSHDEVGNLAQAFNTMHINLHDLVKKVNEASQHVAASSEELTSSAEQTAKASTHVAASIDAVAQGAEKQLQAVTDTMSAVEQLSAGTQQIAATTSTVADMSEKTAEAASEGEKAVDTAISKMADIERTVYNSAKVVSELGNRSKEIGQIIDTISGIASQTNLLALNAAIEAARAGEHGKGFAVVAEEVRKLAEQSQEAAQQIATLIGSIQAETDKAVTAMHEGTEEVKVGAQIVNTAGQSFKQIVGLIDKVTIQVKDISESAQQMAQGSEQIVSSVRSIDKECETASSVTQSVSAATQEQTATIEEVAAASESLASLAQELQATICRFKV